MGHHDDEAPRRRGHSPANRLGLDYRAVPPRKVSGPIVDMHTHVQSAKSLACFFAAASAYGIGKVVSMTPLEELDGLRSAYRGRLEFIAIPRWRALDGSEAFRRQWLADLDAFHARGARWMKFWLAPPMRGDHGLTLTDPFFEPLIRRGLELGLGFLVHVGDPSVWFRPGGRYADSGRYGTKRDQYPQLEFLLEAVAPRPVVAAHLGGSIEEPDFLQGLLDRHANLHLDTSATKWVVREIARQPEVVREFVIRNQDRILFGSDLVVADRYDFEHYASRYWVHQALWETDYRGESPIEDPDADGPPRLAGLNLPADVLTRIYRANAERLGF